MVHQEYEGKIKGLMPAELRQELEDTITSLKAQVRSDMLPGKAKLRCLKHIQNVDCQVKTGEELSWDSSFSIIILYLLCISLLNKSLKGK